MYSSSSGSIVLSSIDGQYMNVSYSVSHVSGYVASPFYTVTFTESGLPSCTVWYVKMTKSALKDFSLVNINYVSHIGHGVHIHFALREMLMVINGTVEI